MTAAEMERLRRELRALGYYAEPKAITHIVRFVESMNPPRPTSVDGQLSLPDELIFKEKK